MGNLFMKYYLFKSDPETYSFADLEKDKKTVWDGIHNYQAINFVKKVSPGDKIYIYHSQTDKAIVGIAEAVSEPFENKKDKRFSWAIDIKFVKWLKVPVTLAELKEHKKFEAFLLIRNGRLSVMEVPAEIHKFIESKQSRFHQT